MTSLILISPGIRNIDQLERSIKVPKITVSALHNQDDLPKPMLGSDIPGPDMPEPSSVPHIPGPDIPGPDIPGPDMSIPNMSIPDMPDQDMSIPDMPEPPSVLDMSIPNIPEPPSVPDMPVPEPNMSILNMPEPMPVPEPNMSIINMPEPMPVPDMPGPDMSIPLTRKIHNHIVDLLDSNPSTLALLYENYHQQDLLDGLEDLLRILPSSTKTIDLLTCNINKPNVIEQIKSLEKNYNITIRYSVDLTGHPDSMGNWVLESHNVSVRDKYFNNMITEWKHVLNTLEFSNDTERYQWYVNNTITIPPLPDPAGMSESEMTSAINSITSLTVKSGLTTQLPIRLIKQNATIESITIEDQTTPYTVGSYFLRDISVGVLKFGDGFLGNSDIWCLYGLNATKIIIEDQTQSYTLTDSMIAYSNVDEVIFGAGLSTIETSGIYKCNINTVTFRDQTNTYILNRAAFNGNSINKIFFGKGLNVVGARLEYYASMPRNIILPNTVTSVSSDVDPTASIRLISLANVSNVEVNLTVYENNRNLRNIDFSGHDLSGINLSGADLTGSNLTNVNLDNTDLTNIVYDDLIGPYTGTPIHNRTYLNYDDENYLVPNGVEYQIIDGTNQNLIYLPGISLNGRDISGMNLSGVDLSGTITGPLTGYANVTLPSGYTILSVTDEQWIVGPGVDLSGTNLSGVDLSDLNLSGANLSVDLSGANLSGANLSGADLSGADLSGAKSWPLLGTEPTLPSGYVFVQGTNESGIIGPDVDLSGGDLSGVDLSGVDLTGAKLWPLLGTEPTLPSGYVFVQGTNESGIIGPDVDLTGADLSGANLSGANLSGIDLSGVKTWPLLGTEPTLPSGYVFVQGTNESGIVGPNVDLSGADLSGADLTNTNLSGVKLWPLLGTEPTLPSGYVFASGTNESGIIGPDVDLSGADLSGVNFNDIDLREVNTKGIIVNNTNFTNVTLRLPLGPITGTPLENENIELVTFGPGQHISAKSMNWVNINSETERMNWIRANTTTIPVMQDPADLSDDAAIIAEINTITSVTIKPGVYYIPDNIFKDADKITVIDFSNASDTLTYIGENAFWGTSIDLTSNITNLTIATSTNLTIDTGAFVYRNIGDLLIENTSTGTYSIGMNAFRDSQIDSIHLKKGLHRIGDYAFAASSDSDIRVTIDDQAQPYSIGNLAFYRRRFPRNNDGSSGLSIGKGLVSIDKAFYNQSYPSDPDKYSVDINLESHEDSEGIQFTNSAVFYNVPINSLSIIGVKSFNFNTVLHSHNEIVTINNMFIDYRSTQVNTFQQIIVQNYNIRNLTIQNSAGPYIVHQYGFQLNAIGKLTLGPGLTEIQNYAFAIFDNSTLYNYSNITDNQIKDMKLTITDQAQPYSIGDYAFYARQFPRNDDGSSGLSIGKGLASIGKSAFYNQSYPSDPDKYSVDIKLESHEDSEGIEVSEPSFYNIPINSLSIIGLPSALERVFYFSYHEGLSAPVINNLFIDYKSTQVNPDWSYFFLYWVINNLTIQNSMGPYIVHMNFRATILKNITLGPGLIEIKENGFSANLNYLNGIIYNNAGITEENKTEIQRLVIENQAQPYSIGVNAFRYRDVRSYMRLGTGLTTIRDGAFGGSTAPYVVLPKTLTTITNANAFTGSTKGILLSNISNIDQLLQQYIDLTVHENNRNLRNIDFSGHDLSGLDLSGADLTDANLSNVNLDNTDLTNIVYGGLIGPYTGTPIHNITYVNHDDENYLIANGIEYQIINGTNQNLLYFPGISLNGRDISGMNLSNVNLSGITTGSLVGYANVILPSGYIVVSGTSESWIIGPGVDLSGANLSGVDLSGADLSGVDLSGTKTWPLLGTEPTLPSGYVFASGTNESGIVGPGVDLSGANLSGVNLSGVNLNGVKTGPLNSASSAPTLSNTYQFATFANEKWIIGENVNLDGINLESDDFSFLIDKPIYGIPNPRDLTYNSTDYKAFKQADSRYMIRAIVTLTSSNKDSHSTMTNGKLIIDQNVKTIDQEVFKERTDITSLDFEQDSVISIIGESTFYGCTNLIDIRLPSTLYLINSYAFSLPVRFDYNKGMNDNPPPESDRRNITVYPGSYKSWRLSIGMYAFSWNFLGNVDLNHNVGLYDSVFENCNIKGNIIIGEGTTSIPKRCFALTPWITRYPMDIRDPYDLDTAYLTSSSNSYFAWQLADGARHTAYKYLNNQAYHHTHDTRADLSYGFGWFKGDTRNYQLPKSLIKIDSGAFYNNKISNETLIIPENVTYIGTDAFTFLEFTNPRSTIQLPINLQYLGVHAFYGVINVNTIIMGTNLRYGTDGVNYPTDENNLQTDTEIGFSKTTHDNYSALVYPTDTTKYFERTDSNDPYMHDYIIDTYSWGPEANKNPYGNDLLGIQFRYNQAHQNVRISKRGEFQMTAGSSQGTGWELYKSYYWYHDTNTVNPLTSPPERRQHSTNSVLSYIFIDKNGVIDPTNSVEANRLHGFIDRMGGRAPGNTAYYTIGSILRDFADNIPLQVKPTEKINYLNFKHSDYTVYDELEGIIDAAQQIIIDGENYLITNGVIDTNETITIQNYIELSNGTKYYRKGYYEPVTVTLLSNTYTPYTKNIDKWVYMNDVYEFDLSDKNLSNIDLSGLKLSNLNIQSSNLNSADLTGTDLQGIDLSGTDLTGANLQGVDLQGIDLSGAELYRTNLTGATTGPLIGTAPSLSSGYVFVSGTSESWIVGPSLKLVSADLSGVNLSGVDLSGVNLSGVDLSGATTGPLIGTAPSLSSGYTFVSGTSESWIVGPSLKLVGADLSGLDLSGANLSGAELYSTNLTGADLSGADLSGANLSGANLSGAELYSTNLIGATTGPLIGTAPTGVQTQTNENGLFIISFGTVPYALNFTHFKYLDNQEDNSVILGYPNKSKPDTLMNNALYINCNIDKETLTLRNVRLLNCFNLEQNVNNIVLQQGHKINFSTLQNKIFIGDDTVITASTGTPHNVTFIGCKFEASLKTTLATNKVALINCSFEN